MKLFLSGALSLMLVSDFSSAAQQPTHNIPASQSQLIETVINAEPIERVAPKYPLAAARRHQEGWVTLSFVVNEQGKVVDPVIEYSSGIASFEKEALKAIKKWKYSPAIRDGKPIEQCVNRVQLDFALHGAVNGVRRKFANRFDAVTDALQQNDLPAALAAFEILENSKIYNRYENAWFWMLDTLIAQQLDDKDRMLSSAGKALVSSNKQNSLGSDNYATMARVKFNQEIIQQDYSAALKTFNQMQQSGFAGLQDVITELQPQADKLSTLLESDELLVRNVVLEKNTFWAYNLSRNNFSVLNVEGKLDTVDIRCENKRSKFTFADQSRWIIPDSWGKCRVFVTGTPNSRFSLVQGANS